MVDTILCVICVYLMSNNLLFLFIKANLVCGLCVSVITWLKEWLQDGDLNKLNRSSSLLKGRSLCTQSKTKTEGSSRVSGQ